MKIQLTLLGGPADGLCLRAEHRLCLTLHLRPGGNPADPVWTPTQPGQTDPAGRDCTCTYVGTEARDRVGLRIYVYPGADGILTQAA